MDKYMAQLEQINASLSVDPENQKFLQLKSKLELLINLKTVSEGKNTSQLQIKEHTSDFPLQVGESCEIFDEAAKYWKLGHIVSMTFERDYFIVIINKENIPRRIPVIHVRRPLLIEKNVKIKTSNKAVQKPQAFRSRKIQSQPEIEGLNQWKKFSDKMIKK